MFKAHITMIIYQITGQSFPHEDPSTNMEKWSKSWSVMSDSVRPNGLYSPWNSLSQNTGVGSLSLLQGIFPTQGSNPGLLCLHCRQIFYQLSHKGSPTWRKESKFQTGKQRKNGNSFEQFFGTHPCWGYSASREKRIVLLLFYQDADQLCGFKHFSH